MSDPTPAEPPLEPRHLRRVLTWALDVTGQGLRLRRQMPVPAGLRPFLRAGRVPTARLGAVARAVESDPAFLERLATVASVDQVGELGMLWLTRPDGWRQRFVELAAAEDAAAAERSHREELLRADRRRQAAEHAQARLQAEVLELRDRLAQRTAELEAGAAELAEVRALVDALRDELQAARSAARSATQRADAAAAKLAAALEERDAAIAAVDHEVPVGAAVLDPGQRAELADLAKLSAELADRVADLERRLGDPAAGVAAAGRRDRRVPLVRPGGVRQGTREEAEFLLRAGAAVLVDGYNVAKGAWPQLQLAAQRERLIACAEDAARRFGADITVVFDGAEVEGASVQQRRLVRVTFSPAGVLADDVIRVEVGRVPTSRAVVVVTDDRAVLRDVRADGANTIASATFVAVAG